MRGELTSERLNLDSSCDSLLHLTYSTTVLRTRLEHCRKGIKIVNEPQFMAALTVYFNFRATSPLMTASRSTHFLVFQPCSLNLFYFYSGSPSESGHLTASVDIGTLRILSTQRVASIQVVATLQTTINTGCQRLLFTTAITSLMRAH